MMTKTMRRRRRSNSSTPLGRHPWQRWSMRARPTGQEPTAAKRRIGQRKAKVLALAMPLALAGRCCFHCCHRDWASASSAFGVRSPAEQQRTALRALKTCPWESPTPSCRPGKHRCVGAGSSCQASANGERKARQGSNQCTARDDDDDDNDDDGRRGGVRGKKRAYRASSPFYLPCSPPAPPPFDPESPGRRIASRCPKRSSGG